MVPVIVHGRAHDTKYLGVLAIDCVYLGRCRCRIVLLQQIHELVTQLEGVNRIGGERNLAAKSQLLHIGQGVGAGSVHERVERVKRLGLCNCLFQFLHYVRYSVLGFKHAHAQLDCGACGCRCLQQSCRCGIHRRARIRPARKCQQPAAALIGWFVALRTGHIFLNCAGQITTALFDCPGLISKERRICEELACLAELSRSRTKIEVIPKHCRGLKISVSFARMHFGHARPVRCGLGHSSAIRIDVANSRHGVQIVGPCAQQSLLDCDRLIGIFGVKVRERAFKRRCLPTQVFVCRVLSCQRFSCAHPIFVVRLPQTRLKPESLGCGIALGECGPVCFIDLRRLLAQRLQLSVKPARPAQSFKQLVAQIGRFRPMLPQELLHFILLLPRAVVRQEGTNKLQIVRKAIIGVEIDFEAQRPIRRRSLA